MASSPSDQIEMLDLAKGLSWRGHRVVFGYVCEMGIEAVEPDMRIRLEAVNQEVDRLTACFVDLFPEKQIVFPEASQPPAGKVEKVLSMHCWPKLVRKRFADIFGSYQPHFLRMNTKESKVPGATRLLQRLRRIFRSVFGNNWRDILRIRYSILYEVLSSIFMGDFYRGRYDVFLKKFSEQPYDALLIPEDIVGPVWPVAIKAARKLGIPTLVFPYTLANQMEAVQSLKGEPFNQTKNNRLAAFLFPAWRWKRDGIDIVRLPSSHIFAHQLMRISPRDPWMMNSGYAKAICVDSQASCEYFLRSGIPAKRLLVTGSVSQDQFCISPELKQERLAALRQELKLVGEKPLLLLSGSPNQLAGHVPHCEFASMQAVADHVGLTLSTLCNDYHLVLRPHPNFLKFGELLRDWPIVSTMIPTSDLIPVADLFVAFASATIRWSVACAVPTINYDIFNYGYDEFSTAKGVVTVSDSTAFLSAVQAMAPKSETYRKIKVLARSDASYWSMTDGRSMDRIESVILSM